MTIGDNCIINNANHISELGKNYVVVNGKKLELDQDRLMDKNEVCKINNLYISNLTSIDVQDFLGILFCYNREFR